MMCYVTIVLKDTWIQYNCIYLWSVGTTVLCGKIT